MTLQHCNPMHNQASPLAAVDSVRPIVLARRFTRLFCGLLVAACVALLTSPVAQAQDNTGSVTGRVLNATNGSFLSKARVSVDGTELSALTNDFGEYEIKGVPAGEKTLTVTYLGLEPKTATVSVGAGVTARQDVQLGDRGGIVVLDAFVIESQRFKNATDIAINEERHSVNIKNVVAADAFGDIPGGNVGEFVKYLPGIELEYGGTYIAPTDAFGVSVRGFGAADTAIYIDGVPIASASQASLTTQVGLDMMSINNASRVELIKVPTPDMKMSSVGGQINLISKSAFEFAKPSFTVKAYTVINSEFVNPFERVAGPKPKKVYAGQPGLELTYVKPVNDKFGISVTASSFSQYSVNRRLRPEWGTASVTNIDMRPFGGTTGTTLTNANGPVSLTNPYMTRVSITDSPRTNTSMSASVKADWRPLPGLSLTGSYQISTYEAADAARRIQIRTQRPQTWDATSTISLPYLQPAQSANGVAYNPGNALDMNIDSRDKEGITHTGYLKATYLKGPWDIKALASASTSRASFKDFDNGHFSTVDVSASGQIGQIKFEDIKDGIPGRTTVYDRFGNVFDFTKLSNWTVPTIQGRRGTAESLDDVFNYKLDVRRQLDFLPWDFARFTLQAGFLREETLKKKWGLGTGYRETYTGPALTSSSYLDDTYLGYDPGFGFSPQEWISTYKLYDIYSANRSQFNADSESDKVNNWNSMVGQNKKIKETQDGWYAMIEAQALDSRLNVVAGLRQESAKRTGFGPQIDGKWNYLKENDGTLYRNPTLVGTSAGTVRIDQTNSILFAQTTQGTALRADLQNKGITFPAAPVLSGTLAAQMRQRLFMRPVDGKSKGDPSYSINLAYDITPKLIGKLAYSRTFGRIPLEDGTAGLLTGGTSFNINEAETIGSIPAGTIAVANPNLLPEIADNWDFALTYYTARGGKLGVGYFYKDITNFSSTIQTFSGTPEFNAIMESIGLDPNEYTDWRIDTSVNGEGVGKVKGYELEVFQDFRFLRQLGDWGKRINVFATFSHTKRSESNTTRISARPAASKLATGGINVSTNRLTFNIKATWRDLTYTQGAGTFTIPGQTLPVQLGSYTPSQTKVDASLNWQITKRYAAFITGRDIFATGSRTERFDLVGLYPAYAHWDDIREFGTQVTVGVKANF